MYCIWLLEKKIKKLCLFKCPLAAITFFILGMFLLSCSDLNDEELKTPILIFSSLAENSLEKSPTPQDLPIKQLNPLSSIVMENPLDSSVIPPDFLPLHFQWLDSNKQVKAWYLEFSFSNKDKLAMAIPFGKPPSLEIDSACISPNNEIPEPWKGAHWSPKKSLWELIKKYSRENWTEVNVYGFSQIKHIINGSENPLSHGKFHFKTSMDSVNAPIFYRDVPLMPNMDSAKGQINPLPKAMFSQIKWRLREVSHTQSKVLLSDLPTCANCHSFSRDGRTIGLDIDGPQSDKGAYGFRNLTPRMDIAHKDIISWNYDYKSPKRKGKTIGFLSRVSPNGKFVVSTVDEEVFIVNFNSYKYIQVFYPTRGILAWYSREKGEVTPLPGADNRDYVHCTPVWTPDGDTLIFARAKAREPYIKDRPMPKFPGDSLETPIQYNLYKMPFNQGRGGVAMPIEGASFNGMSNTFPKVTPDGKYVVFVKCKNGQLMRPDGKLWIVPISGGKARPMKCNTEEMNSWHSFSPNGKWMVFSSKSRGFYTKMFLTHLDANGNSSPALLLPNSTAANRAVNLPEFINRPYSSLDTMSVSAVDHIRYLNRAVSWLEDEKPEEAFSMLRKALEAERVDLKFRAEVLMMMGWIQKNPDKGIHYILESLKIDSSYAMSWHNLGVLYERTGREDLAKGAFLNSIKQDTQNFWAMASLSKLYMLAKNKKEVFADSALYWALKADSISYHKEPSILKTLARAYSENSNFSKAIEIADAAIHRTKSRGLEKEKMEIERDLEAYNNMKKFSEIMKISD